MKYKNKQAFSLTELLIAMIIVIVLFAAVAPIMTKRKMATDEIQKDSVWKYVPADDQFDAYFDPGSKSYPAIGFIGLHPKFAEANAKNNKGGKLTIKANAKNEEVEAQRHIQFRYGEGTGENTGTFTADSYGDMLLGGTYMSVYDLDSSKFSCDNGSFSSSTQFGCNTIIGVGTANNLRFDGLKEGSGTGTDIDPEYIGLKNSTIVGGSSFNYTVSAFNQYSPITSIGANIGQNNVMAYGGILNDGNSNTLIGANTYQKYVQLRNDKNGVNLKNNNIRGMLSIGANTLSRSNGSASVVIGYKSGGGTQVSHSVLIGTKYSGDSYHNTIIGHETFNDGKTGASYMTAIGQGACRSITQTNGNAPNTCIGFHNAYTNYGESQGATETSEGTNDLVNIAANKRIEHVFLGGDPKGGFAGRSVLEVFNPLDTGYNSSVVLNSNLVVRGGVYFANSQGLGKTGGARLITQNISTPTSSSQYTHCHKDGMITINLLFTKIHWYQCESMGLDNYKGDRPNSTTSLYSASDSASNSYDSLKGTTGYPNIFSDIRLKENLSENNDGLEKIKQIKPYIFSFKNDPEQKPQVGVIAQHLMKVFPNAVRTDENGYYKIRWDEMFYALVNAIKTLDEKIAGAISNIIDANNDTTIISSDQKEISKKVAELNSRAAKIEKKLVTEQ